MSEENEPVLRDKINTAASVLSLGITAVKELQEKGSVVIFFNRQGEVELCSLLEAKVDAFPQEEALQILLGYGYDDYSLMAYLKGRSSREMLNGQDM